MPSYRRFELLKYGVGLKAYDLLAGGRGFGASRRVGPGEAAGLVPTLKGDGLLGGIAYRDGQFDDARLAIALLRISCSGSASFENTLSAACFLRAAIPQR